MTQAPAPVPPGRVPPYSLDAERSVLGGVLLDNEAMHDLMDAISPADFYREAHRKIFEAMCALYDKSKPIDRVTIKDSLREEGALEAIGGDSFIDLLDTVVPSASNLVYYATIVREKSIDRRLIEAAHAIASQGYEQHGSVGERLDDAERRVFSITEQRAVSAIVSRARGGEDVVQDHRGAVRAAGGDHRHPHGVRGPGPDDVGLPAGRSRHPRSAPSMGKTAAALNAAVNTSARLPDELWG
jgi:replicative DNA helicase